MKTTVFHCQICKFVGFLLPSSSWLPKISILITFVINGHLWRCMFKRAKRQVNKFAFVSNITAVCVLFLSCGGLYNWVFNSLLSWCLLTPVSMVLSQDFQQLLRRSPCSTTGWVLRMALEQLYGLLFSISERLSIYSITMFWWPSFRAWVSSQALKGQTS